MLRRMLLAAVLGAALAALPAAVAGADGPCGSVPCSSDLSLSAATTFSPIRAGGQTELVFVIADNGPEGAQGVALTHTVPYGLRFVSAAGAPCGLDDASGTVTCQVGDVARGQTVEVRVKVEAVQAGAYVATATVSSTISGDANHGNDTAQTSLQVEEGPGRRPSATSPAQDDLVPGGGASEGKPPTHHRPAALAISAAPRQRILETGGLRLRVTPRRGGAIDAEAVVRLPGGRSLVLAKVWRGGVRAGRPVRVWLGTTSAMKRTLSKALRRHPRLTATIAVRWSGHGVRRTVRRAVTVVA